METTSNQVYLSLGVKKMITICTIVHILLGIMFYFFQNYRDILFCIIISLLIIMSFSLINAPKQLSRAINEGRILYNICQSCDKHSFVNPSINLSEKQIVTTLRDTHHLIPKKYKKIKKYNKYEAEECPICHDEFMGVICKLPCSHMYCPMCFYVCAIKNKTMKRCYICNNSFRLFDCMIIK